VSRISKELDEKVEEFLKRPIDQEVPYLFVDASYFKVRTESRYVTKAFLVITGVREDGYREILGATIADGEDDLFWSGLFEELKERGLSGVKLIVSDGHKGIQKAIQASFLGASWQISLTKSVRVSTESKHVSCSLHASCIEECSEEVPKRDSIQTPWSS
jgi:putative transposase